MNTKEEFNELSTSFAAIQTTFKEVIAKAKSAAEPMSPTTQDCMDAMYAMINHVHNRIDSLANNMYAYQDKHQDGHPYKLLTASHKQKYLEATGMENDYEKPAKKWANAGVVAVASIK